MISTYVTLFTSFFTCVTQTPLEICIYNIIFFKDRNEKLYYSFVRKYVKDIMPLVYTPVVGLACQNFGLVYRRPRGIFITIYDKGHVYEVLKNW